MSVTREKYPLLAGKMTGSWGDWWEGAQVSDAETLPAPFGLGTPWGEPVAINRTTLRVVHLADYYYPKSARRLVTHVRLTPPERHGWQHLVDHKLHIAPIPHSAPESRDAFGNCVVEARHDEVDQHLTLAIELKVRTHCAFTQQGTALPTPIPTAVDDPLDRYREFTPRTIPDGGGEMLRLMQSIQAEAQGEHPLLFLSRLAGAVNKMMTFQSGSTTVGTRASEAWANRRGVCQDFSHITLALLRLAGIPARYVSGFVPGEGVMHAWVQARLPLSGEENAPAYWFAYDPTYNKWVDENYVSVAVGRDYGDITPTSGTYYGGANVINFRNKVDRLSKQVILL